MTETLSPTRHSVLDFELWSFVLVFEFRNSDFEIFGQAPFFHVNTTLPELPDRIASKPFWNSV